MEETKEAPGKEQEDISIVFTLPSIYLPPTVWPDGGQQQDDFTTQPVRQQTDRALPSDDDPRASL